MLEAGLPNLEETARNEIHFPARLLTLASVLTLATLSWLGWAVFDAGCDEQVFIDRLSRIDHLHGIIVHLDEVLTMSANMGAATGDTRWEKRYRQFEPQLDRAIKETMKLGLDPADIAFATQTDEANLKLTELENRAFDLTRGGHTEEAKAILSGPEYEAQKKAYGEAIESFVSGTRGELDGSLRKERRIDSISIIAAVVTGLLSIAAWFSAMRGVRQWRIALETSNRAQANLRDLNSTLERKALEEALVSEKRRSEEGWVRFSEIDEATTDLMGTSDGEGRLISLNRAGRKMMDLGEKTDVTQYNISNFIPKTPNEIISTVGLPTALRDGVWNGEAELISLKGRVVPISQVILSYKKPDGAIDYMSTIARDVTGRKEKESRLQLLSERLSLAIAVAKVGVWDWDKASDSLTWDETMFEIYGVSPGAPLNYKTWSGAVIPEDLPGAEAMVQKMIAEKGQANGEFRIVRGDGSIRHISASERVLLDEHGNVSRVLGVNLDITDRKAAEEALRKSEADQTHSAQHDFLTGLPNRMLLNDRLNQAIASTARHLKHVAVLFLDLDGFKHINDSLGHPVGDKLLQSVAKRLVDCVRGADTVSRQGGDEFVVLLSEVDKAEDAALTATRILNAVAVAHSIDQHDLYVTASIGVSVYPEDGLDAESLIKNADTAMYQAKENGRHGYRFFKPIMNVRAVERQSIEEDLRHALEHREFALHYQPKINLRTGAIAGSEALIRWMHPDRGLISPAQFIPVAEDCGLIVPLGRWVLREACEQARRWFNAGLPLGNIAVNVSTIEFRDDNFLDGLFSILGETGLDPRFLELELTESVLVKHTENTASLLRSLRETGVRVALDDFGTGFSSLSYLRKFPVDVLKIDQSFVRQITADGGDTSIVTAVISLARSLNLRVVAEGVETPEQAAFLRAHECDEAQGYYFSRPVPAEQFAEMLRAGIQEPALAVD